MKTMIIAAALALAAFASTASAHTAPQKPAAKADFAKKLFDQIDRNLP